RQVEDNAVRLEVERRYGAAVMGLGIAAADEVQDRPTVGGGIAIGVEKAVDRRAESRRLGVRRGAERLGQESLVYAVGAAQIDRLARAADIGLDIPVPDHGADAEGAAEAPGAPVIQTRAEIAGEGIGDVAEGRSV